MITSFKRFQSRMVALATLLLCTLQAAGDIPEDYYSRADGKKKEALKQAMKDIAGKAKVLGYGSGEGCTWWGFYVTDRTEDGQVIDRYCNVTRHFSSRGSVPGGMNIEHSFPKSWWGGTKNQAYKDLFNLMPCDSKTNSSKGNFVIGEVSGKASYDNGCTRIGNSKEGFKVWEPADKWKGDFARGYFYMVTAYSDLNWTSAGLDMLEKNNWPTLKPWAYKLLLEWSRQDPVDDIEKKRNEAVYGIQGNRNPFVDYPNLAEYIWGDSVTFVFSADGSSQGGGENPPVGPDEPGSDFTLCNQDFTSSQGDWTVRDVLLDGISYVWKQDSKYGMKASAYTNSKKHAAESWLVSPEFDLTNASSATLAFSHTGRYFGTMSSEATLWASTDGGENWEQMAISEYMSGTNWTFVTSTQDLTSLCGKRIRLAFRYTSTTAAAGTWEIKTVKLAAVRATGIKETPDGEGKRHTGAHTYDLSGRRVPDTQRGLVIHNGKKVLRR
ncbi:MAG TPA: hypothetical protein DC006_07525 [Prevotellaceae bacterium]|nr:hypothetical protein [Prevotellaceae bacterium]